MGPTSKGRYGRGEGRDGRKEGRKAREKRREGKGGTCSKVLGGTDAPGPTRISLAQAHSVGSV